MATEKQVIQTVENVLNPALVDEFKTFLTHFEAISPAIEKAAQITGAKPETVGFIFSSIERINKLL